MSDTPKGYPAKSTVIDSDCCESPVTNPKKDLKARHHRNTRVQLLGLKNPMPEELEDVSDLRNLFLDLNLVPYAGTTDWSGDSLLSLYLMLAQLSPTHNACISKKITYAVGGKATVTGEWDPDWDVGEANEIQMSTAQKAEYRDAVKEFFDFKGNIRTFHQRAAWSYEAVGDAWAEMSYAETLGVGRVNVRNHRCTHCKYVNGKPGEMDIVAISPVWDAAYLKKNPARLVPIYPMFTRGEDGVLRTMFHLKNGDNRWYGRPESRGSDLYKYREVQDAIYLIKQASANFTGQLLIELEDDDPQFALDEDEAEEAGYPDLAERFEDNYTQKSDQPQAVVVSARPYGGRPMFVFQLAPNTAQEWYKVTGELAEQKIVRSHGVNLRFMSFDVAAGFSTETYISDYLINAEPAINKLRDDITGWSNAILTAGWKLLNKENLWNKRSVTFMPPIQGLIEEYRKKQTMLNQPPANNGQPDNTPRGADIQSGGL